MTPAQRRAAARLERRKWVDGTHVRVDLDPSWHTSAAAVLLAMLEQLPEMGFCEARMRGVADPGDVAWRIDRPDFISDRPEWGVDTSGVIYNAPPCKEPIVEMDEYELSLAMSWPRAPYRDEPPTWPDWVKEFLWMAAEGFPMQPCPGSAR